MSGESGGGSRGSLNSNRTIGSVTHEQGVIDLKGDTVRWGSILPVMTGAKEKTLEDWGNQEASRACVGSPDQTKMQKKIGG